MGQWMSNGMLMIGDMFHYQLKAKVDRLCRDGEKPLRTRRCGRNRASWWPPELGIPASVGAQNDMRYPFFPDTRRLALEENGTLAV